MYRDTVTINSALTILLILMNSLAYFNFLFIFDPRRRGSIVTSANNNAAPVSSMARF